MTIDLPNKERIICNFSLCSNWEEKYLYIIWLGRHLPQLSLDMRTSDHLIFGCQSQVWVIMNRCPNGIVQLYGDSDAEIVKGLLSMLFVLYSGMTPEDVIIYDVRPFFSSLGLTQYLTPSRLNGLELIVREIRVMAATFL